MSEQAYVLAATKENFPELVLGNSRKGPVLVDLWAGYAGPSLRQREVLLRLVREYDGRFLLVTLDTEREKGIARELGVKSIPSCKLFRNGKPVESIHGMRTEGDYRELIERHIVPFADKIQAAALTAWRRGDHDKAIQVLAEGAMEQPDNLALPLLLAKLLVSQERHEDAHSVLSTLPEGVREHSQIRALRTHLELVLAGRDPRTLDELRALLADAPEDAELRYTLAAVALAADDYDTALEQIAALVRLASDFRGDLPRRALLALLETLEPGDPRVRRYRQAFFEH